MKKKLIFLLLFIPIIMQGQTAKKDSKGYIRFGTGIFMDFESKNIYMEHLKLSTLTGKDYFIEGGYKLKKGIIVSGNFSTSTVKEIDKANNYYKYDRYNYAASLGYEFNTGKHFKFFPQVGLSYFVYHRFKNPDKSRVYNFFNDADMAVNININYYYLYKNNWIIGIRTGTYYMLALGVLEGAWIGPYIGIKF